MHPKIVICGVFVVAILMFSTTMTSMVAGVGSLTLPSTPQAPGSSVPVSGTNFGATKAVGFGFGQEIPVASEVNVPVGSGYGPYVGTLANRPIKPGSFILNMNVNNGLANYNITDNGDGTLYASASSFYSGTINYVTGQYTTTSTTDASLYTIVRTAIYTRYENNVTPVAGVTTTASGSFTTNITIPNVTNGNYNVAVIDSAGNRAVSSLSVDVAIPEGFSVGAVLLLTIIAVLFGSLYLNKHTKVKSTIIR
jgi:hypothetical protein